MLYIFDASPPLDRTDACFLERTKKMALCLFRAKGKLRTRKRKMTSQRRNTGSVRRRVVLPRIPSVLQALLKGGDQYDAFYSPQFKHCFIKTHQKNTVQCRVVLRKMNYTLISSHNCICLSTPAQSIFNYFFFSLLRCAKNGYTSRWYHLSCGEHFCNECFDHYYRR